MVIPNLLLKAEHIAIVNRVFVCEKLDHFLHLEMEITVVMTAEQVRKFLELELLKS